MRILLPVILLILALVIVSVSPSNAQLKPPIKCLQNQLNELGFDAGDADGLWVAKTEKAAQNYQDKNPSIKIQAVSAESAINWCRRIGLTNPKLQKFWPSKEVPLKLKLSNNLSKSQIKTLQKESQRTLKYLNSKLGFDLAGSITIVSSNEQQELEKLVRTEWPYPTTEVNIKTIINSYCYWNYPISGFAFDGLVVLCVGEELSSGRSFSKKELRELRQTLVHEMAHEAHFQLTGYYGNEHSAIMYRNRGPKWLFEGLAYAIDYQYGFPNVSIKRKVEYFKERNRMNSTQLRDSAEWGGTHPNAFSDGASFAGHLLYRRAGLHSFRKYIESVGSGDNSHVAFKQTFGLSLGDFYAEFDKLSEP